MDRVNVQKNGKNIVVQEVEEPKKMTKKLLIIIVVLALLLVLLGGLFAYSQITDTPLSTIIESIKPKQPDETFVLNEFLMNANSDIGKTNQVMRINVALSHIGGQAERVVIAEPIIRDIIFSNLKEIKLEDIPDNATIEKFKISTLDNLNEHFQDELITGVYVTDLIVR